MASFPVSLPTCVRVVSAVWLLAIVYKFGVPSGYNATLLIAHAVGMCVAFGFLMPNGVLHAIQARSARGLRAAQLIDKHANFNYAAMASVAIALVAMLVRTEGKGKVGSG
jgi:hypothetical protein